MLPINFCGPKYYEIKKEKNVNKKIAFSKDQSNTVYILRVQFLNFGLA